MNPKRPALTLHEAMVRVLEKQPDRTATHTTLVEEIRKDNLYWMKDERPVQPNQIGPRAKNYPELFEKLPATPGIKARIRLR